MSEVRHRPNAAETQAPIESPQSGLDDRTDDQEPNKSLKTYGRTPDNRRFVVPTTHDMLSTLLSPSEPKSAYDAFVLIIIALHFCLLALPSPALRINTLLVCFAFWRASYNVGLGILLHLQSNQRALIYWARKFRFFDTENPHTLYPIIKKELQSKVRDPDYDFDTAPIEFNTWLLFRRLVDLILMCDFVSYVLFAFACMRQPEQESSAVMLGRWVGGLALIAFNAWVKLDAHRVVKDFAWYWGDFFFLIDQNLTFDGVYEIAPHPMYSVGYAGYYGLSLISASYSLFFVSLAAHAAQFAFLNIVENPHIDKTYNAPQPRPRRNTSERRDSGHIRPDSADGIARPGSPPGSVTSHASGNTNVYVVSDDDKPPKTRPIVAKFDLFRQTDITMLLLVIYILGAAVLLPNTTIMKLVLLVHAAAWRLFHTVGIGYILKSQSNHKSWIRHFLKFGEGRVDAWREWRGIYHLSLVGCWTSFLAASIKLYETPASWGYGADPGLFRHTMGVLLIALQMWTATSIYESLGEFGWFYGDFFFDQAPKLTYSGIYRYLNNPERLIGCAALWGMALIADSTPIYFLALGSHILALLFIQFVERPHMEKLYGDQLRREAGLVKTIKRAFPPPVAQSVGRFEKRVDQVGNQAREIVEEFLNQTAPKLEAGVVGLVNDTRFMLSQYPARLSITRLADDLRDYDQSLYSLKLLNAQERKTTDAVSVNPVTGSASASPTTLVIPYGEPIRLRWTAAPNHSPRDWIGLYRIADNASREVTRVASMGRWTAVCKGQYETEAPEEGIISTDVPGTHPTSNRRLVSGEVVFKGDRSVWTEGAYEFRYHHAGKHSVMAVSPAFEIVCPRITSLLPLADDNDGFPTSVWTSPAVMRRVEDLLLPVVRNCFDGDETKGAPETATDEFFVGGGQQGAEGEKYARRVVYAVKGMFGVEFDADVVGADGCVERLAWRVCHAKRVLAPFSMSSSGDVKSA